MIPLKKLEFINIYKMLWPYFTIYPLVVGGLTIIVGLIVSVVLQKFTDYKTPPACEHWNDNHIMEFALFITGAIVYVLTTALYLHQGISFAFELPTAVPMA